MSFNKNDIISAYLAYLSNSVNIDNQKIIEEKLDQLLTERIINSNISNRNMEFKDIMELLNIYSKDIALLRWFKVTNNLIGFCAGISHSYNAMCNLSTDNFKDMIDKFEKFFDAINTSKIKLGATRRKLVMNFIANIERYSYLDDSDIFESLSQVI